MTTTTRDTTREYAHDPYREYDTFFVAHDGVQIYSVGTTEEGALEEAASIPGFLSDFVSVSECSQATARQILGGASGASWDLDDGWLEGSHVCEVCGGRYLTRHLATACLYGHP